MAKGKCPHGEFELAEGCPQCIAARLGKDIVDTPPQPDDLPIINEANPLPQIKDSDVALIQIRPDLDETVKALIAESNRILEYAKARDIKTNDDLKPATEDLSIIAKIKKSIEEKRREYLEPLRRHTEEIREAFSTFLDPIVAADKITRDKILSYQKQQARRQAEAEAIKREQEDLARRAEALNGEKPQVVAVPEIESAPSRVRSDLGMVGQRMIRKWEIVDFAAIPDGYKVVDSAKITKLVKGGGSIPGIRVWEEPTLQVTTKKGEPDPEPEKIVENERIPENTKSISLNSSDLFGSR